MVASGQSPRPDPAKCMWGKHDWVPENLKKCRNYWMCRACQNEAERERYARGQAVWRKEPDPVVVDRLVSGEAPGSGNIHERRAAFVILNSMRMVAPEIARRLGCTERTVVRYRRELR